MGSFMYKRFIKRILDFILAVIGLIFCIPIIIVVSVAIKLDSKGPILFRQKRFGRNKNFFHIIKFRTMKIDAPHNVPTHLLKDPKQYWTQTGIFLRKTHLDEVPQLFNILLGQMSFIGPRPGLWNQDDLIAERDKYNANDLVPGLTGWAQLKCGGEIPSEEKARLDSVYVEKISFLFDLQIFFSTLAMFVKSIFKK